MNEPFTDELISAYLDGELSPDEQANVEQALVESAECRQMFEELRALRGDLQALPNHRLPADFSERVLQRAEQAMLREAKSFVAGGSSNNGKPAEEIQDNRSSPALAPVIELPSQPGQWSGVVWAFAALAAALLVALYLPYLPGIDSQRLAQKTDQPASKNVVENTKSRGTGKPGDVTIGEMPREISGPLARKLESGKNDASDGAAVPLEGPPRPEAPAKKPSEPEARLDGVGLKKPPGPAVPAPAAPPGASADIRPEPERVPQQAAPARSVELPVDGLVKQQKEESDPPIVVVRLQATREALESGAFDALIRKRNIRFEDADAAKDEKAVDSPRQNRLMAERVSAEGVDVVFVEASVAQIDGVLADLQARPDRFLGVAGKLLAEEDAVGNVLLDTARREQFFAQRDRKANGVAGLESSAKRSGGNAEGAKTEGLAGKSGEAKAALQFGGGADPAPARGFAPRGPGAGGSPPAPGLPIAPEKAKADIAKKKATEGEGEGYASRVAPPPWRGRYDRLELRKADDLGDQDAARLLKLRAPSAFEDRFHAHGEKELAEKLPAEKKSADKEGAERAKQARFAERNVTREREEQLDKNAATPERIRVLFVIRAVEQDTPAKP